MPSNEQATEQKLGSPEYIVAWNRGTSVVVPYMFFLHEGGVGRELFR